MIFVTVGTHEQSFNRLIKEVDELKKNNIIKEDVFMQTGFSTYEPKFCKYKKMITYSEMNEKISNARIIITHGGPASFIAPLQKGKIPIVVPRMFEFSEHVNNHQIEFVRTVQEKYKNIIAIYDIKDLKEKILNYNEIVNKIDLKSVSNNEKFCNEFEKIIKELL